ncbi:MAG: hypothetical protein HKN07_05830 [Acidimicrobiia bacterium]|nr:hypothetical protein [Acidimicrobiia bacterium]
MDTTATRPRRGKASPLATAILLALAIQGCGGAAATVQTTTAAEPTTTTTQAVEPLSIEVDAVDFAYEGLPTSVASGTAVSLRNSSETELHEFVAIRLPDDEQRSVTDLVQNPDDLIAYFPNVATVIIAPPGEDGFPVEGDGTLTEPGRYAIICAIPTGVDPAVYLAAAAESEGPPQVEGGPPHFLAGMYAEVIVTD